LVFHAALALTSGGFRIVSDTLVIDMVAGDDLLSVCLFLSV